MPWSDWQDPISVTRNVTRRSMTHYKTAAGGHATYDKVVVDAFAGSNFIFENKPTWAPQPLQQSAMQIKPLPDWSAQRPPRPALLASLAEGVDYGQRPDRPTDAQDKWVEYEAGPNTLVWPKIPLTVSSISAATAPIRIKAVFQERIPEAPGDHPESTWNTISAGAVTLASIPTSATGVATTLDVPDGSPVLLFWAETDSPYGSNSYVAFNFSVSGVTAYTPRWRYWIPEVPPSESIEPITPTRLSRAIKFDCSDATPEVVSHEVRLSNFNPFSTPATSLALPTLGRVVACSGTLFSLLDDTAGDVVAEFYFDGVSAYLPVGVYPNPDDPTECAVLYDTGAIFVVAGLDTDTPSVSNVIRVQRYSGDWLLGSTDPYKVSHGLLDLGTDEIDRSAMTTPLPFRRIDQVAPDAFFGEFESMPYDPAGVARFGPGRSVTAYIGGYGTANLEEDEDQAMTVAVADYRSGIGEVRALTYAPQDVVPEYVPGQSYLDWLLAGSFGLSADGGRGVVLAGYTTLTNHQNSVVVPGQTLYYERYSVVVSVLTLTGSTAPGITSPLPTTGLETQQVEAEITAPKFYTRRDYSNAPSTVIAPDANHIVVGAADLASTDDSTYLEYDVTGAMNNQQWADSIGGPLEAPATPEGMILAGPFEVDVRFRSTSWYPAAPHYAPQAWIVTLNDAGSLQWDAFPSLMTLSAVDPNPVDQWRQVTLTGTLSRGMAAKIQQGKAALVFYPMAGGGNAANMKVSLLKARFTAVGRST